MTTVTIHQAKTHLSKLLQQVENGEEVIIKRFDKPIAKITVLSEPTLQRKPGRWADSIKGKTIYDEKLWKEGDREIEQMFEDSINQPL